MIAASSVGKRQLVIEFLVKADIADSTKLLMMRAGAFNVRKLNMVLRMRAEKMIKLLDSNWKSQ